MVRSRRRIPKTHLAAFAERLKSARITANFASGTDFAYKIGVAPAAYWRWERGEVWPSGHDLISVSRETGYSIHWLLTGEAPMRLTDRAD